MRRIRFLLPLLMLILLLPTSINASTEQRKIYDDAGLLSAEETDQIESMSLEYGTKANIDILIVTTKTINNSDRITYLEDFYDKLLSEGKISEDAVLLLVNMGTDRGATIQGYGQCEYSIDNNQSQSILETIIPILKEKNYYNAFTTFLEEVDSAMNQETTESYDDTNSNEIEYIPTSMTSEKDQNLFFHTGVQIAIALCIGGASVIIMILNSGGKVTTDDHTYLEHNNSRILDKSDQYLRTTVTKVAKPKDNDSNMGGGGSSGGGSSSDGNSHSGADQSF